MILNESGICDEIFIENTKEHGGSALISIMQGGGLGNLNFLSDYASIKNGSYGRLMKQTGSSETSGVKTKGKYL
ncbi:MAG: hypothetical protein HFI44_14235 [Lachnospiraceae bacterium]|nr:hypothetical protein [Lachnospiraceae bacterium]